MPKDIRVASCRMAIEILGQHLHNTSQHHHQNTIWGNSFWRNGVVFQFHPIPETCRISSKEHRSCSGGLWWPSMFLRHFMLLFFFFKSVTSLYIPYRIALGLNWVILRTSQGWASLWPDPETGIMNGLQTPLKWDISEPFTQHIQIDEHWEWQTAWEHCRPFS